MLENGLAAIGFKAYEISSYKMLITLAEAADAEDSPVLDQSMKEEQEMGDWLGSHLPAWCRLIFKSGRLDATGKKAWGFAPQTPARVVPGSP